MKRSMGFSLVELMVAIAIGLVILAGVVTVFVAQRQVYGTATAQASMQNAENAIAAMVAPAVRGAGFAGCGAFSTTGNIINSGSLLYNFSAPLFGFSANTAMSGLNAANATSTGKWTPALDSSFANNMPEAGSDVIVVGGELPGTIPVPVTDIVGNSGQLTILSQPFPPPSTVTVQPGMIGAVSDCAKSIAFTIFSQAGANSNNLIIHHDQGTGIGSNKQADFAPNFPLGSQFVLLQQEAFYVAQGPGGQSALYGAVMMCGQWQSLAVLASGCSNGNGANASASAPQPLVPGVDNMQILYGIGAGGVTQQWVPASAVTNWAQVYAVRMGFLLEGPLGSAPPGANPTSWPVLGTTVKVPPDTRLRHVYVITLSIRNATL